MIKALLVLAYFLFSAFLIYTERKKGFLKMYQRLYKENIEKETVLSYVTAFFGALFIALSVVSALFFIPIVFVLTILYAIFYWAFPNFTFKKFFSYKKTYFHFYLNKKPEMEIRYSIFPKKVIETIRYRYDDAGRLEFMDKFDERDSWQSLTEFYYNRSNLVYLKVRRYLHHENALRTFIGYDQKGRIKTKYEDSNRGKIVAYDFDYDLFGRMIMVSHRDLNRNKELYDIYCLEYGEPA